MPLMIPVAVRLSLKLDSPLTNMARLCSSIVLVTFVAFQILPSRIFCSPNCVVWKRLDALLIRYPRKASDIPVLVEPSLVEWRNFDESETEKHWMTNEQLNHMGYIDSSTATSIDWWSSCAVGKDYDGCSILVGSSALAGLVNAQGWRNGQSLHKMRISVPSCFCSLPSAFHLANMRSPPLMAKMRPFTRTLYEAERTV
uniref:Uncharacterized protein n=1 Tax=Ditylenchus dipsaci TaxID=166011 RepID=A0A915DP47_9BILA